MKKVVSFEFDEWLKNPLDYLIAVGIHKLLVDYIIRFSESSLLHTNDINVRNF